MNPPDEHAPRARFGWIRPAWFLAGLALGLAGLAWLGYRSSRTDFHPGYVRIYQAISPETSYYPTLGEMESIVRAKCRPGQVLVVVGGNSILQGVWQPVGEVWSQRLQALLGGHYCVVNFAFRGSSPTDGGAVVAEALRKEFPHQIYIADEAPLTGVGSWGPESYRYVFWDAYFGGRLLPDAARDARVRELEADPAQRRALRELRIADGFGRIFHQDDWWNQVCYRWLCTIPSDLGPAIPELWRPRKDFADQEPDATDPVWLGRRYPDNVLATEMQIERSAALFYHSRGPDGRWQLAEATRQDLSSLFTAAFPAPLRARTLMLIGYDSPYYRSRLDADEASRQEQAYEDTLRLWHEAGYPAIAYGRNFNENDYGDRIHLSKLGGAKLADAVAPAVRQLAQKLGYLP
ncbi:MAG TPA: hypothetical protein VHC86_06810 [Opitutaceae bacterium]|nr:hypothetical protein [Opitutaceae bacterium]